MSDVLAWKTIWEYDNPELMLEVYTRKGCMEAVLSFSLLSGVDVEISLFSCS